MKMLSKKNQSQRERFRLWRNLSLLFMVLLIPLNSWAAGSNMDVYPFGNNTSAVKVSYGYNSNPKFIQLKVPFYDGFEHDRRLHNATISYSIDGGLTYTTLFTLKIDRFQTRDPWYWVNMTGTANHTLQAYNNRRNKEEWKSVSTGEVGVHCATENYTKGGEAYLYVKWMYGNNANVNNKAITFRVTGTIYEDYNNNNKSISWTINGDNTPVVVGNPLHPATIQSHSYNADGKISNNISNLPVF